HVEVFRGKGDGTLAAVSVHATGRDASDLAIGDLNGDRLPDLVVGCYSAQTLEVLLNGGGGRFAPAAVQYPVRSQVISISLGDFDGDQVLDALFTDAAGPSFMSVVFAKGAGDGTFAPPP